MDENEWVRVAPYVPGNPLTRGFWAAARTVVAAWERTVDRLRGRR